MATVLDTIVRDLRPEDWPQVAAICREGVRAGDATFEKEAPLWNAWDAAHDGARLVAEPGVEVAGWAAAASVSDRCNGRWRDVLLLLARRSAVQG